MTSECRIVSMTSKSMLGFRRLYINQRHSIFWEKTANLKRTRKTEYSIFILKSPVIDHKTILQVTSVILKQDDNMLVYHLIFFILYYENTFQRLLDINIIWCVLFHKPDYSKNITLMFSYCSSWLYSRE